MCSARTAKEPLAQASFHRCSCEWPLTPGDWATSTSELWVILKKMMERTAGKEHLTGWFTATSVPFQRRHFLAPARGSWQSQKMRENLGHGNGGEQVTPHPCDPAQGSPQTTELAPLLYGSSDKAWNCVRKNCRSVKRKKSSFIRFKSRRAKGFVGRHARALHGVKAQAQLGPDFEGALGLLLIRLSPDITRWWHQGASAFRGSHSPQGPGC